MTNFVQGDAIVLQRFYRTKGGKYDRDSVVVVSCVTQDNNVASKMVLLII